MGFFVGLVSSNIVLGLLKAEFKGVGSEREVDKVWEGVAWWVGVFGSVL